MVQQDTFVMCTTNAAQPKADITVMWDAHLHRGGTGTIVHQGQFTKGTRVVVLEHLGFHTFDLLEHVEFTALNQKQRIAVFTWPTRSHTVIDEGCETHVACHMMNNAHSATDPS
jgi:hypothetical protein